MSVRGEVLGGGEQFRVSGSDEVFSIKTTAAVAEQLKASAGKSVTLDATLTPGKDAKAAVPLQAEALRP